jgi:nucleotide-binding universal stress UspA family protein
MGETLRGRVVVGVDDSPAGLRTLRTAVTQARLRDRELVAVRAFSLPRDREPRRPVQQAYGLCDPGALGPSQSWRREMAGRQQQALSRIERAFGQAMGEVPDTVEMRWLATPGSPGPVLVESAYQEDDLLVVGTSAARHRRLFRRSVSRYCVARAACPVLLVPPHALAREVGRRHRPWRRRELEHLLTAGSQ